MHLKTRVNIDANLNDPSQASIMDLLIRLDTIYIIRQIQNSFLSTVRGRMYLAFNETTFQPATK